MNTIKVKELVDNGLSETSGLILRKKIQELLNNSTKKIILDFSGITLFATPFFNSFIGYFVLQYSPERVDELIEITNISDLGKETYNHSYSNAKNIYNKKIDTEEIGEIVKSNIENK
ncbi:MAG: STAS-like domain-containing protein [Bacilli bacterium]